MDERYEREIREQEIGKLATEAELRALRAQINPHFLFNALTTIGYLIQTAPPRALQTLLRLTSLLRAVLKSEGEFTTLEQRLDPARFIRLGRGTLANVDLITKVSVMPGGTHVAILNNGQKLQVSRLQSRTLRERFLKL